MHNGTRLENPKNIADVFNKYFINVGPAHEEKIDIPEKNLVKTVYMIQYNTLSNLIQ